jgi:hypothetical protein
VANLAMHQQLFLCQRAWAAHSIPTQVRGAACKAIACVIVDTLVPTAGSAMPVVRGRTRTRRDR